MTYKALRFKKTGDWAHISNFFGAKVEVITSLVPQIAAETATPELIDRQYPGLIDWGYIELVTLEITVKP